LPVTGLKELQLDLKARSEAATIGMDAIILLPELLMQSPDGWATINTFAQEHNLPLVGAPERTIHTGSVLTYNVNPIETGRLAATLADKILKGTPRVLSPWSRPRRICESIINWPENWD